EFDCETADIAFCIGGAALARHGREAHEEVRLLAYLGKNLRLGVATDIVRDGEAAVRAPSLGVHAPFGDDLAVEMGELLDQPDIVEQRRAARPGRLDIEIV